MPVLALCLAVAFAMEESFKEFTVRGRILCVDDSGAEVSCESKKRLFSLQTDEDEKFFFSNEDPASRMFEDERVRRRELEVKGWLRANHQLEIVKVLSIRNGRRFDIYYFCETCNIKAFVGGLCWCCQKEFEFREVPVD